MSKYLYHPIFIFTVVALISYFVITHYNNKRTDEKTKYKQNDIYLYSIVVGGLVSGIVYLIKSNQGHETSTHVQLANESSEPLQNRPVVTKPEFFEPVPKRVKTNNKLTERIMTTPFDEK